MGTWWAMLGRVSLAVSPQAERRASAGVAVKFFEHASTSAAGSV